MADNDVKITFAKKIKALKENRGKVTWKDIAKKADMSLSTLYSYINDNNEKSPSLDKAISLANYFKVPLSYLCGEIDENGINNINVVEALFKILDVCNPDIGTDNEYPTLVFNKYNNDNNADLIKQFLVEYKYFKKMHSDGIIPEKLLNDYKEDLKIRYAFIPAIPDYEERIKVDEEVKEKRVDWIDKEYS